MSESQKQFATNWRKLAEEAAWFIDNNVGKLDHLIDYEGKTALLEKIAAAGETIPSEIGEKCRAEGCQWIAPSVTLTTAAPQGGALPTLPASREGESPAVAAPVSFPSATPRSAAADLGKLVEGWQAEEDAVNRDAARYRWLNKADNFIIEIEEIRDGLPYKHRRLKCGAVLDKWIDALIKQESADE